MKRSIVYGSLVGLSSLAIAGAAFFASAAVTAGFMRHEQSRVGPKRVSVEEFVAPTDVVAPVMATDSPGQMWMFPTQPARVVQDVLQYLRHAAVTQVVPPKGAGNVTFHGYIGPAQLSFTDDRGEVVQVEPAYSIERGTHGYHPVYVRDVLRYEVGGRVTYLWDPAMFAWMTNDVRWKSMFRAASWTDAQKAAIHDAKASRFGGGFTDQFPGVPGVVAHEVGVGVLGHGSHFGTAAAGDSGVRGAGVQGRGMATFETLVDGATGGQQRVTFVEVWDAGMYQHLWTYWVNSRGAVTAYRESGHRL